MEYSHAKVIDLSSDSAQLTGPWRVALSDDSVAIDGAASSSAWPREETYSSSERSCIR